LAFDVLLGLNALVDDTGLEEEVVCAYWESEATCDWEEFGDCEAG